MSDGRTTIQREPVDASSSLARARQANRDEGVRRQAAAGLVLPTEAVREILGTDNTIALADGVRPGFRLQAPGTLLKAAGDARVKGLCDFTAVDLMVSGVRFVQDTDAQAALVTIGATAGVVFNGCIFERGPLSAGSYVDVVAGGHATFQGCTFRGTPVGGNVVDNAAGLIGDVQIVGCLNRTGRVHANCTIAAEV